MQRPQPLGLTSSAFADGGDFPDLYTCRGENISPPLAWIGTPPEARSLALIMEDPDTPFGTVTHWVLYNIPPGISQLAERTPPGRELPGGLRQGRNGMFRCGYMGPCPPWGRHRYVLRLFALDTVIEADGVMSKRRLMRVIQPHILAAATLLGHYARARRASHRSAPCETPPQRAGAPRRRSGLRAGAPHPAATRQRQPGTGGLRHVRSTPAGGRAGTRRS